MHMCMHISPITTHEMLSSYRSLAVEDYKGILSTIMELLVGLISCHPGQLRRGL